MKLLKHISVKKLFQEVKALVSGSGSGIPVIQDMVTSNAGAWLINAILRFLAWLSSATLKNFISSVSKNTSFVYSLSRSRRRPQIEDDLKMKSTSKMETNSK